MIEGGSFNLSPLFSTEMEKRPTNQQDTLSDEDFEGTAALVDWLTFFNFWYWAWGTIEKRHSVMFTNMQMKNIDTNKYVTLELFRFPMQPVWWAGARRCEGGFWVFYFWTELHFWISQIADLVSSEFGVEFRMMEKVEVKGSNVHPVWRYLTGDLFFTETSNLEYFLHEDIFHLSLKTVFLFGKIMKDQ